MLTRLSVAFPKRGIAPKSTVGYGTLLPFSTLLNLWSLDEESIVSIRKEPPHDRVRRYYLRQRPSNCELGRLLYHDGRRGIGFDSSRWRPRNNDRRSQESSGETW